jgi:hypothetical protein
MQDILPSSISKKLRLSCSFGHAALPPRIPKHGLISDGLMMSRQRTRANNLTHVPPPSFLWYAVFFSTSQEIPDGQKRNHVIENIGIFP